MFKYIFIIVLFIAVAFLGYFVYYAYLVYRPIVKIYSHGGLCAEGECSTTLTIDKSDQIWKDGKLVGKISKDEEINLINVISNTDFNKIRLFKFIGTCPTAADGTEDVYTFYLNGRTEELKSCDVQINHSADLFYQIDQIRQNDVAN
jgi:hypothetical protein